MQLFLEANHFRLELVHLRAEGVALGGFPTAFARGQALKRPLTPEPCAIPSDGSCTAPRGEAAGPPRRAACSSLPPSRIRSRYCAVNLRLFGLATTSGSGAGLARLAPALGVEERSDETPSAGAGNPFNIIVSLSPVIGFHLPPPYCNSKGCKCLRYVGREGQAPVV